MGEKCLRACDNATASTHFIFFSLSISFRISPTVALDELNAKKNHAANNSNVAFAFFRVICLNTKHYLYFCKTRVKQQMEK